MGAPIKANKQTYYKTNTNLEQTTYEALVKIAKERDITFAAAMRCHQGRIKGRIDATCQIKETAGRRTGRQHQTKEPQTFRR